MSDEERGVDDPSKRRFMAGATIALGGATAGLVAGPALVAVHDPIGKTTVEAAAGFVAVGALADFPVDSPTMVEIKAKKRDAWSNLGEVVIGRAWVTRAADDALTVFTSVCPHLGCGVSWNGDEGKYFCPCHTSWFGTDGEALEGPSKRGLDPLEAKVEDGQVLVSYTTFELDIADRVPT